MKKFKGIRSQKEVVKNMISLGYTWTQTSRQNYEGGSDYNGFTNGELFILFNTFTGCFYVKDLIENQKIADENSIKFDNRKWYTDLLEAFYTKE